MFVLHHHIRKKRTHHVTDSQSQVDWESELANLLTDLSSAQQELLVLLGQKRQHMAAGNLQAMLDTQPREEQLCRRLEECHARRTQLLQTAAEHGLPDSSVRQLVDALPRGKQGGLDKQLKDSSERVRLLHHHSLTNWVVAQRSLLHVAQLLEIIATGGRLQPTYGDGESVHARGALVDREA